MNRISSEADKAYNKYGGIKMNKMMKTGLLVSLMVVAGGLPIVAAQETYRSDSAMQNEVAEIYQTPMQDRTYFLPSSHCTDQMKNRQGHHPFNRRFESNRQQQHSRMHPGMWQR